MSLPRTLIGLLAVAAAMLPAAPAGAFAPQSRLVLTVTPTGGDAPASRSVTLECLPTGGTHPNAGASCRDLSQAAGDLARLPGDHTRPFCAQVYAPVSVAATGIWWGRPLDYRATYSNACELVARTGPVFAF